MLVLILIFLPCVFIDGMEHGRGSNRGVNFQVGQSSGQVNPNYPSSLPDLVHSLQQVPMPISSLNVDLPFINECKFY
ncbi:hypothetical protein ACQ4LE_000648 [Meloidogyne hapla]